MKFKLLFLSCISFFSLSGISQLTANGAYFLGDIAEIAINNKGHEGTFDIAGSNARSDQWDPSVYFGFVANPQNDNWVNYDGDFFTPGSPENGFGIEVNGINYSNNAVGDNDIPGTLSNYVVDGNCLSVEWNGAVAGVGVKIKYKFITTELYYTTEVTLTNNTAGALNDLYFYRNFDPDNNVSISFDYTTTNTIVAQPTPACPKALVSATSNIPWLSYVGIAAIGQQFRVAHGGFSNRDASDIWNGTWPLTGVLGASVFMDEAIAMAYKINSLPAGASETFEFVIILDDSQVDEAFAQLYAFDFTGYTGTGSVCNPVTDTAYLVCPGASVNLNITGPGVTDYNWVWSPAAGLSSTTGTSIDAAPATSTLYTVTGTPINPCLSLTIVKEIYVSVGTGPLVNIVPPAPTCAAFDLTTLIVTDANGIPGTTITFHGAIPTSATDMTNVWPSTTMNNGDVVYVMIADPIGGCFDYEQVIVNFSGGTNAGPDNTSTLCNTIGSTLDLNTLLTGADPGTWTETTSSGQFNTTTGVFDASNLAAGNYTFEYTTDVVAPCTPDIAVMTITVNEMPNAGADNTSSLCNTSGTTLDLNTLLSGASGIGAWTETTSSGQFNTTTGFFDASNLTAGIYSFNYTVTGVAPCVDDIATFDVTVEQFANAGLDNATTICNTAGTTIDLNTLLNGNNGTGTWLETTASGQFNAVSGVFDASNLTPGAYTFTYTVGAIAPCTPDVATITVNVTNLPNAGVDNSTSICNSPTTTLTLSTLLSGADPGGVWSETSAIPSGQFNTASSVLNAANCAPGVYTFNYTILGSGPCPTDIASFTVTVEQFANAGNDNITAICNAPGSTINLNTLLVGNNAIGAWAETTTSGQFNPVTGIFTGAGLSAGAYTFTYTVGAILPCTPDVANFTVQVIDLPTAGADNSATLCNAPGTSLDLNSLLIGASVGGAPWTEVTSSGQFNSSTGVLDASNLAPGIYIFNYNVPSIGSCPGDQAIITITINGEPNVNDLVDQTHCDTYTLPAISGTFLTGNEGYYTGSGGTGTQLFPGDVVTSTTNLFIYDETGTLPNCFDEENVLITINLTPTVSFTADTLMGCAPLVVNFTNTTPGTIQNCVWNFGDGYGQLCGNIQHTYLNPGTYTVSLTLQGTGGCSNSVTYTNYILVGPQPEAAFTFAPQQPDIYNSEVTFTNSSTNANNYLWDFGDGSATSIDTNAIHTYPQIGNADYLVTLIATNDFGCVDTAQQIVTVQDVLTFFIPNTFTPDGDEYNQYFLPQFSSGVDPFDYHMIIYNRWGEIIWESYDYTVGWNGTFSDQGLIEDGVYIWQIEFKETMSDKRHTFRGHVTVLK